jgi:hypothetical protein
MSARSWGRKKLWRKKGVRSKLEDRLCDMLTAAGVSFEYEPETWEYEVPARVSKYTPDLKIDKKYYEIKGRFDADDRKKMKLLWEQGYKFTMVFDKPGNKITSTSRTTYGMWCDKQGIPWMSAADFERMFNGGI